jgi:hypothetical protein
MDKLIHVNKHHIEAWGLWWVQWQQYERERMKKEALLISSKGKDLSGNTTTSSTIPLVLLPK